MKGILKKWIDTCELNIYLKLFKEKRNQMYTELMEEGKLLDALKITLKVC